MGKSINATMNTHPPVMQLHVGVNVPQEVWVYGQHTILLPHLLALFIGSTL